MTTLNLAPVGNFQQLFDGQGIVLAGGLLYSYVAGDTIPTATYTTSVGNIPNSNPIQLDSTGKPPQEIWVPAGFSYKFVLTDKNGNVLGTLDNVVGTNDVTLPASISAGTVMIFQQATTPTGWTRISSYDGACLRVVGSATPGNGGTNDMLTELVNQISVDSHVVTLGEFPSHSHTAQFGNTFTGGSIGGINPGDGTAPTLTFTSDNGPGTNAGHSHTLTMGLKYVDTMVCFKN
jgi:hypothetical protein